MCLFNISDTKIPDSGIGYKVFSRGKRNTIHGFIYDWKGKSIGDVRNEKGDKVLYTKSRNNYPRRVWIHSMSKKERYLSSYFDGPYPSGFHIFKKEKDALSLLNNDEYHIDEYNLVVYKIRYKNVLCHGIDRNSQVIVAKSIMLLEEGSE